MTRPQQLAFDQETPGPTEIAPGAWWVPGWLDDAAQMELVAAFGEWAAPPAGLRRPRMPNGAPFSTRAAWTPGRPRPDRRAPRPPA